MHFLTFQNCFWISFSRRILLVKRVGVYCVSWLSYWTLKNCRLYVFEQFDQIWTLITFLCKMLDTIYKGDLLLPMAMKFFWYLDVTWHLQQNFFFYLRNFSMFFFPMFFCEENFFLLNQHTYYQNLKKNFGRHFVFCKFDQIRGGPPTSLFLTFQNFF